MLNRRPHRKRTKKDPNPFIKKKALREMNQAEVNS